MECTVINTADGAPLDAVADSVTFPGESLRRVGLDAVGGPGVWNGISIRAEGLAAGYPAALSFDVIYRWRASASDAWYVELPNWGRFPADLGSLERFAAFSGRPLEEYAKDRGLDLGKPDRPAQTGCGRPFYAELASGGKVLDAYQLGDSVSLGFDDAHPLGFYGRKTVTLYVREDCGGLSDLSVGLYIQPGAEYGGSVWFSEMTAAEIGASELPPELIAEAYPGKRPAAFREAAGFLSGSKDIGADPCLTDSASSLLKYLRAAAEAGCMLYGVQNYPYEKGGGGYKDAPSGTGDVFDLTGADPAVFGLDSLSLIGMENAWRVPDTLSSVTGALADPVNIPHYINGSARRSADAWKKGSVPTLSLHMSDPGQVYDDYLGGNINPATGRPVYTRGDRYPWSFFGYGYDNSTRTKAYPADGRERSAHRPMLRIYKAITGAVDDKINTGVLEVFNAYLDIVADYCLILQEQGVPVLLRPFHESSGDWFWWGPSGCENDDGGYNPDIFIKIWQHLVEYLRSRGVHNALYVYSPNGADFDNTEQLGTGQFRPYVITYPGDAYADVCAFDDYTADRDTLIADIRYVTGFAAAHGKIAAASEVTGSPTDPAVTEFLFSTLADTGEMACNLAYFLQWTPPSFAPYKLSPSRANSGAVNAYIKALSADSIILSDRTNGFTVSG